MQPSPSDIQARIPAATKLPAQGSQCRWSAKRIPVVPLGHLIWAIKHATEQRTDKFSLPVLRLLCPTWHWHTNAKTLPHRGQ